MKKLKFFIFVICLSLVSYKLKANEIMKLDCNDLGSSFNSDEIKCLGFKNITPHAGEVAQLSDLTDPLQEWVWLSEQIKNGIKENDLKKKVLESTEKSFEIAAAGYPNGGRDEEHLAKVELYQTQYQALFEATQAESMIQDALNSSCYSASGFNCRIEKVDDFKLRQAEARSKKLSILMSYPLLANDSIKESIEDEIDIAKDYGNGKGKRYATMNDFTQSRKLERRKGFNQKMQEGISSIKSSLDKRQKDWVNFYNDNKIEALGEINYKLKKREKGFFEKLLSSYEGSASELQTDNTSMIGEILSKVDIKDTLADPYIGKSVCNIYQRNKKEIAFDNTVDNVVNGALFIVPFGFTARLVTLGRYANWGIKGTAALQAGLVAYDVADVMSISKRCENLQVNLLHPEIESEVPTEYSIDESQALEEVSACQEQLGDQILISVAGAALGPTVYLYSNRIRVSGKLSEVGASIVKKFNQTKEKSMLNKFLSGKNLSKQDKLAVEADFFKFKKESGLSGDPLLKDYEIHYNKKYDPSTCQI